VKYSPFISRLCCLILLIVDIDAGIRRLAIAGGGWRYSMSGEMAMAQSA